MTSPNSAIEAGLYARLTADGPLQALGTGGVVKVFERLAPSAQANPYVVFQAMTPGTDTYVLSRRAYIDAVYRVVAFGSGPSKKPAQQLADAIDTSLTDGTLSLTGWTLMYMRREQIVEPPSEELGGVIWHQVGGLYRISVL